MSSLIEREQQQILNCLKLGDIKTALVYLWRFGSQWVTNGSRWRSWADSQAQPLGCDSLVELAAIGDLSGLNALDVLRLIDKSLIEETSPGKPARIAIADDVGVQEIYWLIRRARSTNTRFTRLADTKHYLQHHLVLPERIVQEGRTLNVLVSELPRSGSVRLTRSLQSDKPFAVLRQFENCTHLSPSTSLIGSNHYVTVIADQACRETIVDSVEQWLDLALGATFFLLPECTMPSAWRADVRSRLAQRKTTDAVLPALPAIALLGSFHDQSDGGVDATNGTELIGADGSRIAPTHYKTARVAAAGHLEDIQLGDTLHLWASDIGLIGVAICLEFFQSPQHQAAWSMLAPDWMLVPSMGDQNTTHAHSNMATHMSDLHHTTTLVCNQPVPGGNGGGQCMPSDRFVVLSKNKAASYEAADADHRVPLNSLDITAPYKLK